nr:immunoglobulin heavy chain junction region [Mus musculus]MBK4198342.1 immunoglobulin heavy chain junction region [Mus musculus]MBK4198343.1 immunoglobulin heavy chain junction region [Mus musculus]
CARYDSVYAMDYW